MFIPVNPDQTTIFDALGIDPIKSERPKATPPGPRFTTEGIRLDPIPGYDTPCPIRTGSPCV